MKKLVLGFVTIFLSVSAFATSKISKETNSDKYMEDYYQIHRRLISECFVGQEHEEINTGDGFVITRYNMRHCRVKTITATIDILWENGRPVQIQSSTTDSKN